MVPEKTLRDSLLVPLSRTMATAIQAQPFHCAVNAWRALITFPEVFRRGGRLIEGWFVVEEEDRVTLNEHMWCELADGRIIDPSVLLLVSETTPVFYFPGLMREYAEAEALEGELFPHVRFDGLHGEDGLGHPGYQEALAAARRKMYALALAKKPPKTMQFLTARDLETANHQEAETTMAPLVVEGGPMDLQRSLDTSREIQAAMGHCWYNTRKAFFHMPNAFLTSIYVEGWVVSQWPDAIRVTEHGWAWTPHAGIVDPTIVLEPAPTRLVYLPGVQLSWRELQQYGTTRLPLARERGLGDLAYQEACQRALQRAEALAWSTGLPVMLEPGWTRVIRLHGETLDMMVVPWALPSTTPPSMSPLIIPRSNDDATR